MPCDLTEMEVQILYLLWRRKCFKTDAGYHNDMLESILRKKYDQNFNEAISNLKNKAYIATIRKKDLKYYILDLGKAYSVLKGHGLNVTPLGGSRIHHLD
jgi:hypothetical protein